MKKNKAKAGIRLAAQPKNKQTKHKSNEGKFMNQPAIKCRIELQTSRDDLLLLSRAADLIDQWQRRDPENRYAFFTTCDARDDTDHSGGYHFERFFKGDKQKNLFEYMMMISSNFIADEELNAGINFIQDTVLALGGKLKDEWKEQLTDGK